MTTTINLTEAELSELQAITKESDAAVAVRVAMDEFIRQARRQQLKQLSGRVTMQETWRELDQAELGPDHEQH